jgi:predicted oxidoreductase
MAYDADAIIVGAGLAGLVAAAELVEAGKRIIVLDQEPEQSLGGQAFWSLGGIFLVDSPEQRRMRIRDSHALALDDWMGTAAFDRDADFWPRQWAEAYVAFAAGEKRAWLHERGVRFFPVVGWAERGGHNAIGHGNSVPRFHLTWGTGPGVVAPFIQRVREGEKRGLVAFKFRHRVNELVKSGAAVDGVRGDILEPSNAGRGQKSSRQMVSGFELMAQAVIVASGGIGASHELIRKNWPERLGPAPERMITGVPDHVDGRMLAITAAAGGTIINPDRMWHYVEGIKNWNPIWTAHAIVSCLVRHRSGSTRAAGGCRLPFTPASTRSAPSSTSWRPATIIPGSCSLNGSSRKSSRYPVRSRIRISPGRAGGKFWAARAAAFPARSRPSWTRARISSSSASLRRW